MTTVTNEALEQPTSRESETVAQAPARRGRKAGHYVGSIPKSVARGPYEVRAAYVGELEMAVLLYLLTVRLSTRLQFACTLDPLAFAYRELPADDQPDVLPVQPWLAAGGKHTPNVLTGLSEVELDALLRHRREAAIRSANKRILDLAALGFITVVRNRRAPGDSVDRALRLNGTRPSADGSAGRLGRGADTLLLSRDGLRRVKGHLELPEVAPPRHRWLADTENNVAHSLIAGEVLGALLPWVELGLIDLTSFEVERDYAAELEVREGVRERANVYRPEQTVPRTDLLLRVCPPGRTDLTSTWAVEFDRGTERTSIPAPGAKASLYIVSKIASYYRLARRLGDVGVAQVFGEPLANRSDDLSKHRPPGINLAFVVPAHSNKEPESRLRAIEQCYVVARNGEPERDRKLVLFVPQNDPSPTAFAAGLARYMTKLARTIPVRTRDDDDTGTVSTDA